MPRGKITQTFKKRLTPYNACSASEQAFLFLGVPLAPMPTLDASALSGLRVGVLRGSLRSVLRPRLRAHSASLRGRLRLRCYAPLAFARALRMPHAPPRSLVSIYWEQPPKKK